MSNGQKISVHGMRKHFESCSKHQDQALLINPDNKDDFLDLIGAPWDKEDKNMPAVIYFQGMKVFLSTNVPEGEVWIAKPPALVKAVKLKP